MTLTAAAIRIMAEKGMTALDIAEVAEAMAPAPTSGAARQARYRERKRNEGDVTRDVTTKESTPPKEYIQTPHAKKITPLTPQFDFVGTWNAMAEPAGLPTCQAMSRRRLAALRSRLSEVGEDGLRRAIAAVGASPFCRGENDRGWQAGPDFVLQETSLTKLLEGQYSNLKAANSPVDERQAFLAQKYGRA